MKTKLLIIDRGQLGILTVTLKYCEYLHRGTGKSTGHRHQPRKGSGSGMPANLIM